MARANPAGMDFFKDLLISVTASKSPGASMSLEEKLQISRVFDELGVDIIEAGFPIASPGDFEAVTEISKTLKRSIPA